jgi:DNA-binding response OmpR family regulator
LESPPFILLVEDEPLIALSVQEALEDGGYAVRAAVSGIDAISVFDQGSEEISALITDIRLGTGPEGWDVARHARELNPRLPIVYMSGDSSHGHSSRGVPDSLMIQKPFAPAQIVTAVSTLLNAVAALPTQAPPDT